MLVIAIGTTHALLGFGDNAGERERAHAEGEAQHAADETLTNNRLTAIRLEFDNLNEVRRDLESKIAKMQARMVASFVHYGFTPKLLMHIAVAFIMT